MRIQWYGKQSTKIKIKTQITTGSTHNHQKHI